MVAAAPGAAQGCLGLCGVHGPGRLTNSALTDTLMCHHFAVCHQFVVCHQVDAVKFIIEVVQEVSSLSLVHVTCCSVCVCQQSMSK
jgi:hypothetical protein